MYKKIFNALSALNLIGQALYTLALPIGGGALLSYLLCEFAGAPSWIWAILLTVGTVIGLYSMVKFIILYAGGMDRLEKQRQADLAEKEEKERRQAALRDAARKTEDNNDRK